MNVPGAENVRRANEVAQWASEYRGDHTFADHVLEGILYAATAQAEELLSLPYRPGQDTVTVHVSGDNREELLAAAFCEAEDFFGPERRSLRIAERWGARPNALSHSRPRTQGRYLADITFSEVPDGQD